MLFLYKLLFSNVVLTEAFLQELSDLNKTWSDKTKKKHLTFSEVESVFYVQKTDFEKLINSFFM